MTHAELVAKGAMTSKPKPGCQGDALCVDNRKNQAGPATTLYECRDCGACLALTGVPRSVPGASALFAAPEVIDLSGDLLK